MNQEEPWKSTFTLKASDVVKELGWDKRKDITKQERLKQIAAAAFVLDCLLVRAEWQLGYPNKKGKVRVSIQISRIWNVTIDSRGERNLLTNEVDNPDEIYITVQPGIWSYYLLNQGGALVKEALYQFGYVAKEVFKIDPHHDELALRLALHLTIESRYHQSGRYKVETLLKNILPGGELTINKARNDRRFAQKLKNQWNNALKLLTNLEWQIIYDKDTYFSYLQPSSTEKCPRGYFDQLLAAKITILPPDPIPLMIAATNKTQKTISTTTTPPTLLKRKSKLLTPQDIREGRKAKGYAQKDLAQSLEVSQQYVSLLERGQCSPTPEQQKILCELLDI